MKPRVLVNAGGAGIGGGTVWAVAFARELERRGDRDLDWEFFAGPLLADRISAVAPTAVRTRAYAVASPIARIFWDQLRFASGRNAVLLSAGNYGPLARSDGHVLMCRNALHFDGSTLQGPKGVRLRLESVLARMSARRATEVITATNAMAQLVSMRTARHPVVIPFGPGLIDGAKRSTGETIVFVHRTFWAPHKRFETLLRAVSELARSHDGKFLIRSACDPRTDFARKFKESAADRELLLHSTIERHVEFRSFPLNEPKIDGDAIVMPSTTESFCFPIAEAIGADLPVIAADSPFARELCGTSVFLVEPGDPIALAAAMKQVVRGNRPPPYREETHRRISWQTHVDGVSAVCRRLASVTRAAG